jgi:hypothetical protein
MKKSIIKTKMRQKFLDLNSYMPAMGQDRHLPHHRVFGNKSKFKEE